MHRASFKKQGSRACVTACAVRIHARPVFLPPAALAISVENFGVILTERDINELKQRQHHCRDELAESIRRQ